jgi:hypothetical protein
MISAVDASTVYANVLKIVPSCGSIADLEFAGICFESALSGIKGGIRGGPFGSRSSSELNQSLSGHRFLL